mmetsp:Transcript_22230/g.56084  ORF Transcript_22230/g.56084 Transcript_22230/m.56084 type:complete len:214 (+) Transcript_22230:2403-3044(+)
MHQVRMLRKRIALVFLLIRLAEDLGEAIALRGLRQRAAQHQLAVHPESEAVSAEWELDVDPDQVVGCAGGSLSRGVAGDRIVPLHLREGQAEVRALPTRERRYGRVVRGILGRGLLARRGRPPFRQPVPTRVSAGIPPAGRVRTRRRGRVAVFRRQLAASRLGELHQVGFRLFLRLPLRLPRLDVVQERSIALQLLDVTRHFFFGLDSPSSSD